MRFAPFLSDQLVLLSFRSRWPWPACSVQMLHGLKRRLHRTTAVCSEMPQDECHVIAVVHVPELAAACCNHDVCFPSFMMPPRSRCCLPSVQYSNRALCKDNSGWLRWTKTTRC